MVTAQCHTRDASGRSLRLEVTSLYAFWSTFRIGCVMSRSVYQCHSFSDLHQNYAEVDRIIFLPTFFFAAQLTQHILNLASWRRQECWIENRSITYRTALHQCRSFSDLYQNYAEVALIVSVFFPPQTICNRITWCMLTLLYSKRRCTTLRSGAENITSDKIDAAHFTWFDCLVRFLYVLK